MRQFGASVRNIGTKAITAGLGGVAAIALPFANFMKFDDAIRMTGAVSQSTAEQLAMLRDTAEELGRTTSFTAVQVAELMGELGRAGFSPDQINRMTGAVLNLARASGTEAALSAGIMAATIRQFSLEAGDATRVADVLTKAANSTFNSVESLGEALSYAGPVAAQFGMSLEDAVAVLGTLGNVGIQGSNAGTALRRLVTMTAAEADKMRELFGVEFLDAAGNIRPLVQVMGELAAATNGLPSGERAARMSEAFGLLGITAASVMAETAANTQQLAADLRAASGTAARTAEQMDAGAGGSWRILMSAIEGAGNAIGTALAPQMQRLAAYITQVTGTVTAWIQQNEGLIVTIATGIGYLLAAGIALQALGILSQAAAVGITVLKVALIALTQPMILIPTLLAGIAAYVLYTNGVFAMLSETLLGTFGGAWDVIVQKLGSGDLAGAMQFAWELAKGAFNLGVLWIKQQWQAFAGWLLGAVHSGLLKVQSWWDSFWGGLAWAVRSWAAHVADEWQKVKDLGNRALGREIPQRETNAEKLRKETEAAERKKNFERRQKELELQNALNAGNQAAQQAINEQMAQIADLVRLEKSKLAAAQNAAKPPSAPAQAMPTMPAPQAALARVLTTGTQQAVSAAKVAVEAVDKNTIEGQAAVYEALVQGKKDDPTTQAVVSLERTLEDEFDKTRRADRNAPRLAGSRKG